MRVRVRAPVGGAQDVNIFTRGQFVSDVIVFVPLRQHGIFGFRTGGLVDDKFLERRVFDRVERNFPQIDQSRLAKLVGGAAVGDDLAPAERQIPF